MSSSIILVSLCVIRVEILDEDSQDTSESMAAKKMRGRRRPTEISIETYSRSGETTSPLLSSSESSPSTSCCSESQNLPVKASSFHTSSVVPVYYASGSLPVYQPSQTAPLYHSNSLYQFYQPPVCGTNCYAAPSGVYTSFGAYQVPVCNAYQVCATMCQVQGLCRGGNCSCTRREPTEPSDCENGGEECLQFKCEVENEDEKDSSDIKSDNKKNDREKATECGGCENSEQDCKGSVSSSARSKLENESQAQVEVNDTAEIKVQESARQFLSEEICSESSFAQTALKTQEDSSEDNGGEVFSTDRSTIEFCKGILHLFKENELTEMQAAANRTNTVCILSVPSTMTCKDLLRFMGPFHQEIQHVRILRDNSSKGQHYLALISFRSSRSARAFYEAFNGTPFTSLEPEIICNMVFVARVELANHGRPIPGHTELPTCPVCLERMDESVDGVLTTLCSHSFHSACIAKCKDDICPVCRNAQVPERWADSHCIECVADSPNEDLWICLICGHIGCSRYQQGHAFQHYHETYHCYAMQLSTNRVWDYVGDNFVHRLMQNKDGKMVEGAQAAGKQEDAALEEKIEAMQLEFTHLLTSQLEVQRKFFEERLSKLETQANQESNMLKEKLESLEKESSKIKEDVELLRKEKQSAEKKLQSATKKFQQTQERLGEEKALRKALEANQSTWKLKCEKLENDLAECKLNKESEIASLNEQLQDIMLFLDAQRRIEESTKGEEIEECVIVNPNSPGPSGTRSQKSKKRR